MCMRVSLDKFSQAGNCPNITDTIFCYCSMSERCSSLCVPLTKFKIEKLCNDVINHREEATTMRQQNHHRNRRSSRHRVVALSFPPPFVRLACLIGIVVLIPFVYYNVFWTSQESIASAVPAVKFSGFRGSRGKNRLAIIIPFVGEGSEVIPPYLDMFCVAAGGSTSLVDFLLIHNGVLDEFNRDSCPPNVRFISLSHTEGFSQKLLRVMDLKDDEVTAVGSKDKLAKILAKHIIKYPYVLVEFKPALGHIFAEYIEDYSHWGYSDLDILFGDLQRWVTEDELNDFDIVTYGFGDQDRLYLRGQFTFHKNKDDINQIWRSCDYLHKLDQRFADVMSGAKSLHFESAEGCYSAAVLKRTDIKVK